MPSEDYVVTNWTLQFVLRVLFASEFFYIKLSRAQTRRETAAKCARKVRPPFLTTPPLVEFQSSLFSPETNSFSFQPPEAL